MTQQRVYTPGEAARELDITTQSLRRYAQAYAEVFEPVAQHAKQRVFTDEVVERLRTAQALQQANRAPSIREALELVKQGVADTEVIEQAVQHPDPVMVLAETVRALQAEIVALRQTVEAQSEQLKALTPPTDTTSGGKAEYVAEMEQIHADYERRLKYLQGELERRNGQVQQVKRPWWKFWS
jgi:DNA-binding transcriptional MerR regulator